jgi:hypothetical protein
LFRQWVERLSLSPARERGELAELRDRRRREHHRVLDGPGTVAVDLEHGGHVKAGAARRQDGSEQRHASRPHPHTMTQKP